jgi:hypothetical protein
MRGDRHRLETDRGIAEDDVIARVLGGAVEDGELGISFSGCRLKLFELLKVQQLRCHLGVAEIEQLQSPADGFSAEESAEDILEGVEVRRVAEAAERVGPSAAHVADHCQGATVGMPEEALGQAGCEGPVRFADSLFACENVQLRGPGAEASELKRDETVDPGTV